MSVKCTRCGTALANGWIGPCPKCGQEDLLVSGFAQPYGNVLERVADPAVSGSIVVATSAVSVISGAYNDAKIRLSSLRVMGIPEKHLLPLEQDINQLNEDKMKAEAQLTNLHRWSSGQREEFARDIVNRLDKHAYTIRRDIKLVGMKVDGTADLIRKLGEKVATKEDLEAVEKLLVQNEEILIDALNQKMTDLKAALIPQIEKEAGPEKANRFWQLLEKLSLLGGTAEFAEYVKRLIDFLIENKVLQTALPIFLKVVFG